MIAQNQNKSKAEEYNKVQMLYSDFYNNKIDALIKLTLAYGATKSEVARCLDVTRQALNFRIRNIKAKEASK